MPHEGARDWEQSMNGETSSAGLLALLSSASDVLSTSLAPEDAVRSFARLVVPALADWSVITLVDADGKPHDVESWHRDPSKRVTTARFAEHRLSGRVDARGSLAALRSGKPFVLSAGALDFTRRTLRSRTALNALAGLEMGSVVVVPMLTGGRVVGLITLARGPARPPMSDGELAAAVDLSRRASITLANARSFERQRSMSELLQLSMLTEPVQPDEFEVVVRYEPAGSAAQVGGDWYDVFRQRDGSHVLVVGDVVGHDLTAAAVMGQLRSLMRGIGVTTGSGPAQLLQDVDRAIEALHLDTSATAAAIRVVLGEPGADRAVASARLRYSNAGHPPPVLLRDGVPILLEEHDLLLGLMPELRRQEGEVVLGAGDTLLMYTDGLVERRREDPDSGSARLCDVLVELGDLPLSALVDQLIKRMVPDHHDDDVAVLAVRIREEPETATGS